MKTTLATLFIVTMMAIWPLPTDPIKQAIRSDQHVIALQLLPDLTEADLRKIKKQLHDEALIEMHVHKVKVWPVSKKLRWISFSIETLDGHQGRYEGAVSTKKRKIGFYLAQDKLYEKKLKGKFGIGILPNGIFK